MPKHRFSRLITVPDHYFVKTADVIVYRDGEYAVAVDTRTRQVIAKSTDHTSVIQAGINHTPNGGKIYITTGKYDVYDINIDKPLTLISERADAENLYGAVLRLIKNGSNIINIKSSFVRIVGLTLYGQRGTLTLGHGIYIDNGYWHIDILNNRIMYMPERGIYVNNNGAVLIQNNEIRECGDHAIAGSGLADSFIIANEISSLKDGIRLVSSGATQIALNKIFPVNYGLYLDSPQRISIISNIIEPAVDTIDYGIYIVSYASAPWGRWSRIIGNEIFGSANTGSVGILLRGSAIYYNIIASNTIRNWGSYGIEEYGDGEDYNFIVNNILVGTGGIKTSGLNTVSSGNQVW